MNKLGPYDLNRIYTGDARELALDIPDNSVDLIFTDPVYQNLDDYRWLAETAARVLKDSGHLLTCVGIGYLRETLRALDYRLLHYRWQMGAFQPNGPSRRFCPRGFSKWWSVLWYSKQRNSWPPHHFPDMVKSVGYSNWFGTHEWRKGPTPFISWLNGFTEIGDLVVDFFCGGGTVPAVCKMLSRNYLAFEIDPDVAEQARERVANTQPPLFVPEAEQAAMLI